jgi:arginase
LKFRAKKVSENSLSRYSCIGPKENRHSQRQGLFLSRSRATLWPNMAKQRVSLIGVPTDIGASHRGGSMGPEALRVAGLEQALRALGHEILDRGNVSGPVNPMREPIEGYRHLDETIAWCENARDAIYTALVHGDIPVMLGGDHCLAMGSIAAVSKFCRKKKKRLVVFWLDAHADFNTPNSSPSGNLHGMPVAVASGFGHQKLLAMGDAVPMISPTHVVQIGIRSVDAVEKIKVSESGVVIYDMRQIDEIGMRGVMEKALAFANQPNTHLHVSFDVDFLDPMIAPGVATTVSGGPNYREAQLCMEMIHDSGLLKSLDVVELNPAFDIHNRTAKLAVELVESLFGKQILSRNPVKINF